MIKDRKASEEELAAGWPTSKIFFLHFFRFYDLIRRRQEKFVCQISHEP